MRTRHATCCTLALMGAALWISTVAAAGGLDPTPDDLSGTWLGRVRCKVRPQDQPPTTLEWLVDARIEQFDGAQLAGEIFVDDGGTPLPWKVCGTARRKWPENPRVGAASLNGLDRLGNLMGDPLVEAPRGFPGSFLLTTRTFEQRANGRSGRITGKGALLPVTRFPGECTLSLDRVDDSSPGLDVSDCRFE